MSDSQKPTDRCPSFPKTLCCHLLVKWQLCPWRVGVTDRLCTETIWRVSMGSMYNFCTGPYPSSTVHVTSAGNRVFRHQRQLLAQAQHLPPFRLAWRLQFELPNREERLISLLRYKLSLLIHQGQFPLSVFESHPLGHLIQHRKCCSCSSDYHKVSANTQC